MADNQVKGFIVENKTTPGFSVEKIENKIALKVVQNGHITMKDVRVPEANRLQGGNSFRDTAKVLRNDALRRRRGWRPDAQMGAYEAALKYAQERLQFGKPIGSFQMVQDLLAKMLANVTACQCLMVRLAQTARRRQAGRPPRGARQGVLHGQDAARRSRGPASCWAATASSPTTRSRASSRTAEALYSYEGTYQMQNLIVGKAITGLQRLRVSERRRCPFAAGSHPDLARRSDHGFEQQQ